MTAQTATLAAIRHFDMARVLADCAALAQERFAGRRIGTQGHDQARDWLVERMQGLALHPITFPFTLETPVVEVYAPVHLTVPGMQLQRRRDFSEHPRSADLGTPRAGRVTRWQAAGTDWHDQWVSLTEVPRGPALTALAEEIRQAGGLGLLVPQHPTVQGYLVKRVVMGEPVAVPVLAVRADLLPMLEGQQVSVATPVRPLWARGDLVIGEFAGSDATLTNAPLILGAHYDGVGSDPGRPVFPCATDNAAGVAVILEIARLLESREIPLRRPVRFVAFDAEEINAQGSRAYAQHLREQGESPLVLNLDGAAQWHDHLTVEAGVGAEMLIPALDQAGTWLDIPLEQGNVSSDNRRFAGAGFPAIGLSAGLYGLHTPADTLEHVDPMALRQAGTLLLAAILQLAA